MEHRKTSIDHCMVVERSQCQGKRKLAGQTAMDPTTDMLWNIPDLEKKKRVGEKAESGYFLYYLYNRRQQAGWFCSGQAMKKDGTPCRNVTGVV